MTNNNINIPPDIWAKVEKTAGECQKTWGMGFPVISISLLKQILRRQEADTPDRDCLAKEQ